MRFYLYIAVELKCKYFLILGYDFIIPLERFIFIFARSLHCIFGYISDPIKNIYSIF